MYVRLSARWTGGSVSYNLPSQHPLHHHLQGVPHTHSPTRRKRQARPKKSTACSPQALTCVLVAVVFLHSVVSLDICSIWRVLLPRRAGQNFCGDQEYDVPAPPNCAIIHHNFLQKNVPKRLAVRYYHVFKIHDNPFLLPQSGNVHYYSSKGHNRNREHQLKQYT